MNGMRRLARTPGRSAFGSVSVLALLALACFPVLAHADSSGVQYSDIPPTATGGKTSTGQGSPARSSGASGGASAPSKTGSAASGSSTGSPSSTTGGVPSTGSDGGTGQSSPDNGSSGKTTTPGQSDGRTGAPAASQDDGSSPLIPILIAILVLAAISLAAVMIRQRRQRGGPGSPKAS